MKKIYPQKLQPGDEIRIICPSSPMNFVSQTRIQKARKVIESLGYKVTFGTNSKDKIGDLTKAFLDKNVKMVWPILGGYNANQLLEKVDYSVIKNNPKIFCGRSDITVLNNAIFAQTGLITYSGPNFGTMDIARKDAYTISYFLKCCAEDTPFTLEPSKNWYEYPKKKLKNIGPIVIQSGGATGTCLGGNLCSFNLLQGTKFLPSLKDTILFFEDDPLLSDFEFEFERNLQSVLQQKDADKICGIVIGRFQKDCKMTVQKIQNIIFSKPGLKNIPVIANVDFGHTSPMFTFPIGGEVTITAQRKKIEIELLKF